MSLLDFESIPCLQFSQFAPEHAYYALLMVLQSPPRSTPILHYHDFFEITWMRSGSGIHFVNGEQLKMQAGEVILTRPHDRHAMWGKPQATAINVAFPASTWRQQGELLGLDTEFSAWEKAPLPPTLALTDEAQIHCSRAFEATLAAFAISGNRAEMGIALGYLWLNIIEAFLPQQKQLENTGRPDWLMHALHLMELEENLRGGVARLGELAAVRPEHLARVMRRECGQTPTDWVNALRLQRAAGWLLGTEDTIDAIAARCGFGNSPHFYRLFTARYGLPPRRYRLQARLQIQPNSMASPQTT